MTMKIAVRLLAFGLLALSAVRCGTPDAHETIGAVRQAAGNCTSPADCDDGLLCTLDQCDSTHTCVHPAIPDCCTADTDCDDKNTCTADKCNTDTSECSHVAPTGCCTVDKDCDDGDSCTTEACDLKTHTCNVT